MTWTDRYWDALDELYWWPPYIGLGSISRKKWERDGDFVKIPASMVHSSGPLYRRVRSSVEYDQYIRRQEETFNQILDLGLAVLPGFLISDLLSPLTGIEGRHDFQQIGRELRHRFDWIAGRNVSTPDCFFISDSALMTIELKFGAKTSLDQFGKYVSLLVGEEQLTGNRKTAALLYVFTKKPNTSFEKQTGYTSDEICSLTPVEIASAVKNRHAREFLETNEGAVSSLLSRLEVRCVTWEDLRDQIQSYIDNLGDTLPEQTVKRVLSGLVHEIQVHPLSEVDG